jgi:ATP-dependent Lon protease
VLPIGGLKEKSMAAYRGGVKTVFIPMDNLPDLDEVDEKVKENVEFVPVSFVDEIITKAIVSEPIPEETEWKMENQIITPKARPSLRQRG